MSLKLSIRVLAILFLVSLAMGKEYYGNITCAKCDKLKCESDECYFWNGGPYPHL